MSRRRSKKLSPHERELQRAAIAYAEAVKDFTDDPQSYKTERDLDLSWFALQSTARRFVEVEYPTSGAPF